ncbi:ABC-F family ATP-binding cassette domain-containing protein [Mesomycoplasma hyopneumoniae]|uniref:ATP-binding cassette domain-containing protein n=3 Tax=Mesomycoplasma hyopneumoniae TaxID=2099 RepID=A0A223M9X4_MESHO|nr:ATP-binding cassette domain-containing protein [Mesomycoplasma hyopneumoniae]AAZ44297.1 putative ABC transporter ATP-binding protein [Mesomycoplasma hyopneumoniae J]AAZ53584.1 ABC transporter ATP-binding protein [Mesomycoplasma hyopneumoniae 7448]ASU14369.1 putative ABC transporter ATP-binding protein YbiT [Mesomycoplasma hyopneumoniae]MCI8283251.1 ATP-binding cassette domain-containing protein [Mesomycoplasma hyopneumoniae]MCI8298183.1 ATP-binding cassette domain-containing protein [Mesomy
MLEVRELSKIFADKTLFQNVNLKFTEGNTYGIIGANGAGKSTFLKILAGLIEPSSGSIHISQNQRISVLSQNHFEFDEFNVTDVVIMGNQKLYQIQQEKDQIYANPDATEADYNRAGELEEKFGLLGGWSAENDAQILLSALEIPKKYWNSKMSDLKSGYKVKVLLAKALFGNPDILIMDEPTNHLDFKAIKWLKEFLINYKNVVLIVSHDSDFLDQVCTHTVDIDYGEIKIFTGNYSFWKQSSELLKELQKNANAKKEEQIAKLEAFIAKFSANASKSAQATSRKKSLEKIQLEEIKPSSRKYPYIRFGVFPRPGKQVLNVENLSYKNPLTGNFLFQNISFNLLPGQKMVIFAEDDLVKTKLLEILTGKEMPTSGTISWGSTIKFDYLPANNDSFFNGDLDLLSWISQWPSLNLQPENKDNSTQRMRGFLGRMFFNGDQVFKKVSVTSGGEKVRLMFAKMMLSESNFLLFDQPLNHLDSESIDSFIEALKLYDSGVIFTTFNLALINEVANVILDIKEDSAIFFQGNLAEYEKKIGI